LVWGIKAVPDPIDGVDAAQAAVPIAELARFQSEISRAIGELLMPRHDGIEIEPIEDSTQAGSGFLAIWVDRSGRRPHRSEVSSEKNYFKRIGASSYPMEHYDIEDAFNRIGADGRQVRRGEGHRAPLGVAHGLYMIRFTGTVEDNVTGGHFHATNGSSRCKMKIHEIQFATITRQRSILEGVTP
jgi:hypothetical protein